MQPLFLPRLRLPPRAKPSIKSSYNTEQQDGRKILCFVWKKDKQDKKVKQNLKLALLALLILGLLLIFGRVFQFFNEFQKPFYSLNTAKRVVSWDGKSVINLIIAKSSDQDLKNFNFVSLNPVDEKITILKLSEDIYVNVPKNFGSWKLSSVYKLGQENRPSQGEDLLKMSVSKMLALPVDGIIEVSSNEDLDVGKLVGEWKNNKFSALNFITRIKTDLSLKETVDFVFKASKVRQDNITSVDFFRTSITQSKLLPDSSRVLGVDNVKLDNFIKQSLQDPTISDEDITVAVFNGTDHPGLTFEAARLVGNLGARVTIINNTDEKFVKNGIYINPEEGSDIKSSQTYKRLAEIFAPSCLKEQCSSADAEVASSRAAINIVLGEEYFNYWSSR